MANKGKGDLLLVWIYIQGYIQKLLLKIQILILYFEHFNELMHNMCSHLTS